MPEIRGYSPVAVCDLDMSMTPELASELQPVRNGVPPMTEFRAKDRILMIARGIIVQQKLVHYWAKNSRNYPDHDLGDFIDQLEVREPYSPTTFVYTIQDFQRKAAESDLPIRDGLAQAIVTARVTSTKSAELCEFEGLYYMTCAKIRQLHEEVKRRLEAGFARVDNILHIDGAGLRDQYPVTLEGLLLCLNYYWKILQDPAVISTLDFAVRQKKIRRPRDLAGYLTIVEGLENANGMPSPLIVASCAERLRIGRTFKAKCERGNELYEQQLQRVLTQYEEDLDGEPILNLRDPPKKGCLRAMVRKAKKILKKGD